VENCAAAGAGRLSDGSGAVLCPVWGLVAAGSALAGRKTLYRKLRGRAPDEPEDPAAAPEALYDETIAVQDGFSGPVQPQQEPARADWRCKLHAVWRHAVSAFRHVQTLLPGAAAALWPRRADASSDQPADGYDAQ
jgi:hypothetical protein